MPPSADDLAESLREGAHGDAGIQHLREVLEPLTDLERLEFLNATMLTPPLDQATANARAGREVDPFNVLQGDIVVTSAGFQLGVRQPDQLYVVASSTCDLQESHQRQTALLLAVEPKRRQDFSSTSQALGTMKPLTLFKPKRYFYLPPLPDDPPDVLFNLAHVDPLYTIATESVNMARRRASMTLFGWRLFGVMVRELLVREGDMEDVIRTP